ncbi:MAG: hypothetical protein KatS3mg022_2917 [Armatimonadota bacterium]|nr:MAG: hypothetical protein KatS3mg022_2917 [Armatimonadota bacterium]
MKSAMAAIAVLLMTVSASAQRVVGHWDFNGNLNGTIGNPLVGVGNFFFETAVIGGQTAQVVRFGDDWWDGDETWTTGHNTYFIVPNPIGANGGGIYTNRYTIIMDVMFPVTPGYVSLYQTNPNNTNDGDWFIFHDVPGDERTNGLGISGNYSDPGNPLRFQDGVWQRIALVIDTTTPSGGDSCVYRCYINGQLQNIVQSPSGWGVDGRFSLGTTFLLFADEDGETQEGFINCLQLRDYPMSDAEIAALGGPSAAGIPIPAEVSGTVNLGDYGGDVTTVPVTVEIRNPGETTPVETHVVNLNSSGQYAFITGLKGTFDVAAKASHWLRSVKGGVTIAPPSTAINFDLINGDIDGDNEVTLFDFGALVAAFGSVPGDSNWNPDADLDGDEEVTLFDFGVLVRNFGAIGDE